MNLSGHDKWWVPLFLTRTANLWWSVRYPIRLNLPLAIRYGGVAGGRGLKERVSPPRQGRRAEAGPHPTATRLIGGGGTRAGTAEDILLSIRGPHRCSRYRTHSAGENRFCSWPGCPVVDGVNRTKVDPSLRILGSLSRRLTANT